MSKHKGWYVSATEMRRRRRLAEKGEPPLKAERIRTDVPLKKHPMAPRVNPKGLAQLLERMVNAGGERIDVGARTLNFAIYFLNQMEVEP